MRGGVERGAVVDFVHGPGDATGALGVEHGHEDLDFQGLARQRTPGSAALGVVDGPALRDETVEGVGVAERGFNGEVRQVVEGEERRVPFGLGLEGKGPVGAEATEHAAGGAAEDFDAQGHWPSG